MLLSEIWHVQVKGTSVSLDELPSLSDTETLTKYHKIIPNELKVGSLVDAITCHMAGRDCL
jgi:hypothetical protein